MSNNDPTPDDLARDLNADLALCEAATPPPWEVRPQGGGYGHLPRCIARPRPDLEEKYPPPLGDAFRENSVVDAYGSRREDLDFIAAARTGWPAAIRRLMTLESVIRDVHAQHADDNCWLSIDRIFATIGLPIPDRRVGDKAAMKANCDRFIDVLCQGGRWKSYAELEAENAVLTAEVVRLRRALASAAALASEGQTPVAAAVSVACRQALCDAEADSEGGEA